MELQPQKMEENSEGDVQIAVKPEKKVLHFCDGTMEENSDEEETQPPSPPELLPVVDPSQMTWVPWLAYKSRATGSSVLAACDYLGENLAWFFGITTPKYQSEIEEYERSVEEKKKEMEAAQGWTKPSSVSPYNENETARTDQPQNSPITPV